METVLLIGATSSLAQAMAHLLAKRGCALALAGRDQDELELLAADLAARHGIYPRILPADFLSADFSPQELITQADCACVIIAAGDMGNAEIADLNNLSATCHVTYVVPAQLAAAAAAHMSEKKHGTIVIISSVAGDRGRQSNIAYGAAKAALSSFASGLRNRFHKEGVHVMTAKPGFIDTPMTWGMHSPLIASREYAAKKILRAMARKKNVVYVPFFWRWIMLVIIHIPEGIFKRLRL